MLSISYSRPTRRPLIASEALPRLPLRHIIAASVAMSLPLMTLMLISASVSDLLFSPPIDTVMTPIVDAPNLPLVQSRNVVVGHLVGCMTGTATLHILGSAIITAAVAAGVAFALILLARVAHSPATATAMVTMLMPYDHGLINDSRFIGFIFALSIMVMVLGILANRLCGLRYPTYWWQVDLRLRTPARYGYRWNNDIHAKAVD